MREHQIVISLKSEHFQQVQRMARAAGSKSVGLFIRQRLLSALGLDGQDAAEPERGPDWQRISGQLRRLHRELQVFIAESTSADTGSANEQPLIMPEENFLTEGAPILPNYNYDYQPAKGAISPSHSAINKHVPSFDAKSDEMEKLADRAFAISPRLGALEPINTRAKDLQDPLNDLLGGSPFDPAPQDEDDTEQDEEKFEAEDETAEAQEEEEDNDDDETAADDETDTLDDQIDAVENDQQSADSDATANSTGVNPQPSAVEQDDEVRPQRSSATNDEIDTQAGNEVARENHKDMGNPPTPPPISGGPPPRKR